MNPDQSFYFYDLETSGFSARDARIMQFAGQRTDMNLNPVGEPHNIYIKMTNDIVPDPDAIMVTGITPQKTLQDGLTEIEFLKFFTEEVATPGTIFTGFNTIRFDDEFVRFMHYRNFYDAYEWQWSDGRSKWDLLDVVRMIRALRPEGIKWPVDSKGAPSNRLELLTSINGLDHKNAHDALSDVNASIALAKLLKEKQPKTFDYLLSIRDKKEVANLVESGQPFVYTSGKYPSEFDKTTVAAVLTKHPTRSGCVFVFDLRHNVNEFINLTPGELAEAWRYSTDQNKLRLPVKTLQYNKCPAVAPLGVLDSSSQSRLGLQPSTFMNNFKELNRHITEFAPKLLQAADIIEKKQQTTFLQDSNDVDSRLYESFVGGRDKTTMSMVRAAKESEIANIANTFEDQRLRGLLPLYRARNFPAAMTDDDRSIWEAHRYKKLLDGGTSSRMAKYFARIAELANGPGMSAEKRYLLEELQLYGQSIMPDDIA